MNMHMNTVPETLENITAEETEPVVVQQHRLSSIMPIIIFSYIGVLIRLGLAFLGNSQTPLSAAFWPNFVGCFFMGFVVEQKLHIQHHFAQLYMGFATGLCGSVTTFSGLMYDSCLALFGPSSHYIYPVSNYFSVMIAVFASSFIGYLIGRHISVFLLPPTRETRKKMQWLNNSAFLWLFFILALLSVPLLVLLAVFLTTGRYIYFIYSLIFAPLGSLTRYGLSLLFNKNTNFPLGTLLANMLGSGLYLGLVAISDYVQILSPLMTQIVIGLIQGYCGCLTTVSTFILELDTITKRKYVYFYFLISVVPIQVVYIIFGDVFPLLCSPL